MTEIDTSREVVESLVRLLKHNSAWEGLQEIDTIAHAEAIAILPALLARAENAERQRDEAWNAAIEAAAQHFAEDEYDVPTTMYSLGSIQREILTLLDQPAETEGVTVHDYGFLSLIRDGMAEGDKAMRNFPQPNYVISKFAEESGEVVKAAIHCAEGRDTPENVLGEMRQVIAMMYRLWVEGDQVHALRALSGDRHE